MIKKEQKVVVVGVVVKGDEIVLYCEKTIQSKQRNRYERLQEKEGIWDNDEKIQKEVDRRNYLLASGNVWCSQFPSFNFQILWGLTSSLFDWFSFYSQFSYLITQKTELKLWKLRIHLMSFRVIKTVLQWQICKLKPNCYVLLS